MKRVTKRVLSGIEAQQFKAIAATIQKRMGITLPERSGSVEAHGFRIHLHYDSAAELLTLELMEKPWYVPESLIEQKIDEWLTSHPYPGTDFRPNPREPEL